MMMRQKRIWMVLLAVLAAATLQAQDRQDGQDADAPRTEAQLTLDDLRTFTDVFNQVRRNYVEPVDDRTLLDAALRGMLLELDPHSSYLPGKELKNLNDSSQGRYSGIGVDIQIREQKLVVNAVIDGSPADEAGINPGDIITSIDGRPIRDRPLTEAKDELLGEPESLVKLTVQPPQGEAREVTLTRRYIVIPTLSYEILENGYGYFKITTFHRESATHVKEALDGIAADGVELEGIVLDLRDNPGGILQQAIAMADGFLDEGVIVTTRGRNSAMQMKFSASPGQWLPGKPLVILVDRGSASASEVLAGALQDHDRALIIGEQTFGKGSVQSVLPLRNGAGIKLTTARYYTPSGHSIQAQGIKPDVVIQFSAAEDDRQRESDLDRHLDRESAGEPPLASLPETMGESYSLNELLGVLKEAGILDDMVDATADKSEENSI
jgi:carboxyl-terminal processing protease